MNILRQTIRQMILEGLKFNNLQDTVLLKCKEGPTVYYLLLDSSITQLIDDLFADLKEAIDEDDWGNFTKTKPLIEEIMSGYSHLVLGMAGVKFKKGPLNATEIKMFAANGGWGPTLYDIVMGEADGIIADRETVSPGAYDVYKYYHDKRSDIRKTPLDSKYHQWTPDPTDDTTWGSNGKYSRPSIQSVKDKSITQQQFNADPLNWVYDRGPVPEAQQAYSNADALLTVFDKWSSFDPDDVLDYFTEKLAIKFFHSKYERGSTS